MLGKGLLVSGVEPGSVAERHGIRPVDRIIACNGRGVHNDLDFAFNRACDRLDLAVRRGGDTIKLHIASPGDGSLGLAYDIPVQCCRNHCMFCFVDQMPPGLRESLYVKDEDIRQSFLYGAYVTLADAGPYELDYIAAYRLSPLYVSIHATSPEVRARLLGRSEKLSVVAKLRALVDRGITLHGQIVLVPGINDFPVLAASLDTLLDFYPGLQSLSLVPVGITRHRAGLPRLTPYTTCQLTALVDGFTRWRNGRKGVAGSDRVYLADEIYLALGRPVLPAAAYGDFAQLDNGVGMVRCFIDSFTRCMEQLPAGKSRMRNALIVLTGQSFAPVLRRLIARWNTRFTDTVSVQAVTNTFFGDTVTVSGLLTYQDVRPHLDRHAREETLLPDSLFNCDDMTIDNIAQKTLRTRYTRLSIIPSGGRELAEHLSLRLQEKAC